MKNILVYVTGHGFGHASRTSQLLNCLAGKLPDAFFHIRTGAPEWYFRHLLDDCVRFEYSSAEIDIGAVQNGPLNLSKKKTLERFAGFWGCREDIAEREAQLFRDKGISLIVADIPPLAFLVARRLGVPSVGVTNFTWNWIYADYVKCWPEYSYLIPEIEDAYRNADLILRLPFAGPVPPGVSFEDVPLVARRPRKDREYVLASLNIRPEKPLVLISFGGFPLSNRLFESLESLDSYTLVTTFPSQGSIPSIHHITEEQIVQAGLRYTDIVNAVDMVAGKPGYGLVSECISCGRPLLYTSRGCFAEYRELVKGIKRYLRSVYIPRRDLLSGRWTSYLDELNSLRPPSLTCNTDGDRVVSEKLIAILHAAG
jgi:L-arabinokinase